MIAVKQIGFAIQHIDNPNEEVQLTAIKQNGQSIKYINKPTYNIYKEVLYNDPALIRYVDIIKYPDLYNLYVLLSQ